jgi:hypothetical protein
VQPIIGVVTGSFHFSFAQELMPKSGYDFGIVFVSLWYGWLWFCSLGHG